MKQLGSFVGIAVAWAFLTLPSTYAGQPSERWSLRLDMGGNIPEEADLNELNGPVSGLKLKLDPGFQMDMAAEYAITEWLRIGPELGFTFNWVDSLGGWSYPDTTFGQLLMFANLRIEYPTHTRLAPFVGGGIGGVASFLTFYGGSYHDYYYDDPDGTGSDFSLGFQVFGGLRYRVGDNFNIGVVYRYLATDPQHFDVEWWDGSNVGIGVDSIRMHSICLVLSGRF